MTKEEMLSSIYDEMADKTLSDGCYFLGRYGLFESQVMKHRLREVKKELVIVRDFFHSYEDIAELYLVESHNEFFLARGETLLDERMYGKIRRKYMSREGNFSKHHKIDKIIGHPVLIGDVIEYIRLKNIWDINPITDEWDYPRLPVEKQSDEAILYVYNLIIPILR